MASLHDFKMQKAQEYTSIQLNICLQILKKLRTKAQNKSHSSLSQILLSTLQEKRKDVNLEKQHSDTPYRMAKLFRDNVNSYRIEKVHEYRYDKFKSIRSEWKVYGDVDYFKCTML